MQALIVMHQTLVPLIFLDTGLGICIFAPTLIEFHLLLFLQKFPAT